VRLAPVWMSAILAVSAGYASAQTQASSSDTYKDPAVRSLILRAREAREAEIEGMESYEGQLRERIYVGLTALRFRRERSLFEQERLARIRWSADGERAIQWMGARRAIPVVGADTRRAEVRAEGRVGGAGQEVRAELRNELSRELLDATDLPAFAFDPAGDRLTFGEDWALHPLSDTADAHYRFASGDTLRIRLPPPANDVVLHEVRVEPRRADFHLVAGSLWFDAQSASLVRASYRPARAFNLALDEPQDAEDVPGILQPIEAEIRYITVEYSLHELRFWLPRRFALEGEARVGRWMRIPLTVEWSVRDYRVNEAETELPVAGPLPPGWSRREQRLEDDDGKVSYLTVIVPETEELLSSPELSGDFGERAPVAFTDGEIDELRGELEAMLPTYQRFRPDFAWGLQRGLLRYNRVEGLSAGGALDVPLSPSMALGLEGRIGTGDWEPNMALTLRRGPDDRYWTVGGYHRLRSMGDWGDPFSLKSSLDNLLFGSDEGEYVRVTGVAVARHSFGARVRWSAEAFHERQREVSLGTDFHLVTFLGSDSVRSVLPAEAADLSGARGSLNWFSGVDPNGLIVTGQVLGEAATGDAEFQRLAVSLSASHPLPFGLAGAMELGGGTVWGEAPVQSMFFLGGGPTLRGFPSHDVYGPTFWRGRAEVASGFAGARVGLFSDLGWAGEREDLTFNDPYASVGLGASLLDGLLRFDVARAIRRQPRWKVHLYLDGLF
jgi:hypothetical protein